MKKFLLIAGPLAGITLLILHFRKQIKLLTNFCYNIIRYHVNELNRKRISFSIDISIKNKSLLDIKIEKYIFDVFINDKYVASVQNNKIEVKDSKTNQILKNGMLPGNQFGIISIDIEIIPNQVIKNVAQWDFLSKILLDQKNSILKIEGYVTANFAGIDISNLPIKIEKNIADLLAGTTDTIQPPCI